MSLTVPPAVPPVSSAVRPPAADLRSALRLPGVRWHRPLVVLAILMVVLAVVSVIGLALDGREVTGLDVWAKPLKFSISTAIYAITLAWLVGQLTRFRRIAWIAGTITMIALTIELVIIAGFAAAGETSHFNVSTPLHTTAWSVMAFSIVVVWGLTLLIAVLLFRNPLGDPARTLAIRAGVIIAFVGMGLAFLMTGPTADQLNDFRGIAGAHTVGTGDGGPGLPILGWSTVAGDLRIPHFVGMHSLQVLPIVAILLELLATRIPRLAGPRARVRLVAIATAAYAAAVALILWQALVGQSIVEPSGPIPIAAGLVALAALTLTAVTVIRARTPQRDATFRP
ncbi:hypothetical protein [Naasia lichenicola]|uniref:Uncharacterized protein n=1 Tax=Naasia lichenicola TaxID=2565933 RepID=A0A4S4FS24_9MICO|nr:hypothetical protein [Naasia lichenicola]THG33184.1 hypothetical protein E6C64_02180 [Naasia lichenicola]